MEEKLSHRPVLHPLNKSFFTFPFQRQIPPHDATNHCHPCKLLDEPASSLHISGGDYSLTELSAARLPVVSNVIVNTCYMKELCSTALGARYLRLKVLM